MTINKSQILVLLITLSMFALATRAEEQVATPDVRLLIDISGSMKKNDPNNLRVPALQLVTNLLPQNADAGVWAFGQSVNMLVPLAQVDSAWQDKATKTANKINSAGLFTNIGGALTKASYGWTSPNPGERRSMILLTDGMVDISKDPKVNAAERTKIIQQILPKLVKADVTIHTIALSQNADHELLKTLSTQTDGWYQAVESPEELQKVFLKIFEQSTARDSLPLENNQFNVDASVEEMTLLVFKQNATDMSRLIQPDNAVLDKATTDGRVRWFTTAGYELITVKTPQPGEWNIDAKVDPDNRVMVVSKLSLNVSDVPNNLLAGEAINYQVSLLEEGKLITKTDFLELVDAKLLQSKQGQTSKLAMFFDGSSHQFKQNFFTDSNEGVLNLTLEVKSPTFERTRNHAVNIYGSPLVHELTLSDNEQNPHEIVFSVREDIVKADSLKVTATIQYPDDEKQYLSLDDLSTPLALKVFSAGGDYSVELEIKGQSILGRKFAVSPASIIFNALPTATFLAEQNKKTEPQKPIEKEPVEAESMKAEPEIEPIESAPKETVEPAEPEEEESNWTLWLIIGLAINILLAILGVIGWKVLKSKRTRNTASLSGELGLDADDEDEDDAGKENESEAKNNKD